MRSHAHLPESCSNSTLRPSDFKPASTCQRQTRADAGPTCTLERFYPRHRACQAGRGDCRLLFLPSPHPIASPAMARAAPDRHDLSEYQSPDNASRTVPRRSRPPRHQTSAAASLGVRSSRARSSLRGSGLRGVGLRGLGLRGLGLRARLAEPAVSEARVDCLAARRGRSHRRGGFRSRRVRPAGR